MEVIKDNSALRITLYPGSSGCAVVAFAGIGLALGAIPQEEFKTSLDGLDHDFYFVIDKQRRWYNGLDATIVALLNRQIRRRGTTKVATLGNSMGGFGAIIFAGQLLNCQAALAFVPQSSVDPAIVDWEHRWGEYRRGIEHWTCPDAVPLLREGVRYSLVYGAADGPDMRHAARFDAANLASLAVTRVPGVRHEVAKALKQAGRLRETIGEGLGL